VGEKEGGSWRTPWDIHYNWPAWAILIMLVLFWGKETLGAHHKQNRKYKASNLQLVISAAKKCTRGGHEFNMKEPRGGGQPVPGGKRDSLFRTIETVFVTLVFCNGREIVIKIPREGGDGGS